MHEITSREGILKKIRQALIHKTTQRFPGADSEKNIYVHGTESKEEAFAMAFTKVGGQFIFCENVTEFKEGFLALSQENNWEKIYCREKNIAGIFDESGITFSSDENYPEGMVSITGCEALVSRLGSVIVSSRQGAGRKLFVAATSHVIVAYTSQVVADMKDALSLIRKKYSDQLPSLIASLTGPSRTADIEKTLVTPAHGPRDIIVFLIDE